MRQRDRGAHFGRVNRVRIFLTLWKKLIVIRMAISVFIFHESTKSATLLLFRNLSNFFLNLMDKQSGPI